MNTTALLHDLEVTTHANGPTHNLEAKRFEAGLEGQGDGGRGLGPRGGGRHPWMKKPCVRESYNPVDVKLWPAAPANVHLPAARAIFHRGCARSCPRQTFRSCPLQSPPSMWRGLPVAHPPSLPDVGRFEVQFCAFVAAREYDGGKATSLPLPLCDHDWCTTRGP